MTTDSPLYTDPDRTALLDETGHTVARMSDVEFWPGLEERRGNETATEFGDYSVR